MNTEPEDVAENDPACEAAEERSGSVPMTEEEYEQWLLEDPKRGEVLQKIFAEVLAEKRATMTPEQLAEAEALSKQFAMETADFTLPVRYNKMADRLREILAQEYLEEDDVEELEKMGKEMDHLLDIGLDLEEPRRTKAMGVMMEGREMVRRLVEVAKTMEAEAYWEEEDDEEEDEEDEEEED